MLGLAFNPGGSVTDVQQVVGYQMQSHQGAPIEEKMLKKRGVDSKKTLISYVCVAREGNESQVRTEGMDSSGFYPPESAKQ